MTRVLVVWASGRDQPGLVERVTRPLAQKNCNIVDIEQTVVRGLFSIVMLVEVPDEFEGDPVEQLRRDYAENFKDSALIVNVDPYVEGRRRTEKVEASLTVLGRDRPGIVNALSRLMASFSVNILRVKMISRGELIAMRMDVDLSDLQSPGNSSKMYQFKERLRATCDELDVSHVLQVGTSKIVEKKLIVFDMDATLVEGETIVRIAHETGFQEEVERLTREAMEGKMDFVEALKARVKLLKGVKLSTLEAIADDLKLTPGAQELIQTLKAMGFKIALISGGFSLFTEHLKEKLGLDYAFGNKLVVEDGVLTGEVDENLIIDAKKKGEILRWLAKVERISPEQIVAVGDGSNDRFMLENAGLGIGFEPKEVLKKISDGVLSKNLFGLLYCLGLPEKKLRRLSSGNGSNEGNE
ncbi:MAG: phosphoserine phosphatase SerB [Promethearchaeota archaeon]